MVTNVDKPYSWVLSPVIFCILQEVVAGYDDVVRHRCNNRRCINPEHLELGSRGENLQDEREFAANGVDFGLL